MQEHTDLELETTVPTDLTVSSFSDEDIKKWKKNRDGFNAPKNYAKDLQLLKLELVRKNALIQKLQCELTEKTRSFEEKLKVTLHQNQIAETRLKAKFSFSEEDLYRTVNSAKEELQKVQLTNVAFENDIKQLKLTLVHDNINEDTLLNLKMKRREELSLTEFVLLKMYEREQLLRKERDSLKAEVNKLQTLLSKLREELQTYKQELQKGKTSNLHIKEQYEKLLTEHTENTARIYRGNYAQENFQRIKFERDQLNNEVLDAKQNSECLKAELKVAIQDKDSAKQEISKLKQNCALLHRECEMINQQLSDAVQKWGESQDKVSKLQAELDRFKSSRGDLMERLLILKDQQKVELEEQLTLAKIQITNDAKFKYDQEIRSITETKNSLLREKQTLEENHLDLRKKYEELFSEYDGKRFREMDLLRKIQGELTVKESKIQKLEKTIEELQNKYEGKCQDYDKVNSKYQRMNFESDELQKSTYEKNLQLEKELGICKARLEVFEKLESELNELVNETAHMDDSDLEENLGEIMEQLPRVSAKMTFIRNVALVRKKIELEKTVETLCKELAIEKEKRKNLAQKIQQDNNLFGQVKQPYFFLVSTVRENEKIIEELTLKLQQKKEELELAIKQNSKLEFEKNQLINDLGTSLKNGQELFKIAQQLESLKATDFFTVQSNSTPKEHKSFKN